MTRISLEPPRTTTSRIADWYSKRRFGMSLEPSLAMSHQPKLMRTVGRFEMTVDKWDAAPRQLKHLAVATAAATVGCEWCMDFGYWIGVNEGMDAQKLRDLPYWRDSTAYSEVERAVIEYAEAASGTPMTVTDDMVDHLRRDLDDAAIVEITMMIGIENQRARFNSALGLAQQGFAERCELAPR
jgi:alkylhydroperoxidase family enzyme